MTAAAVRPTSLIPVPRSPASDVARTAGTDTVAAATRSTCRAVAYQRVLHQLVRRELRLLAELATWAPDDEAERTATLTRHAELVGQRPAAPPRRRARRRLARTAARRARRPDRRRPRGRSPSGPSGCARIDHMLRDVATAARQWPSPARPPRGDAFALACRDLADAVDAQTADEERVLLPLLGGAPRARGLGGDRPLVALPAHRPASSCSCSAWRSRTPAPSDRARLLERPVPGGPLGLAVHGGTALPRRRRPAAGCAARGLSGSQ